MADAALTPGLGARISALLRFDFGGTDVHRWAQFAREVLALLLFAVVTIAGLAGYLATRQARELLQDSALREARAIADAVARAAFVPMSLEDDRALAALVDSYRSVEHVGSLRIVDSRGATRGELAAGAPRGLLFARAPVLPLEELGFASRRPARGPIGVVEVGMRTDWIDAKARANAATNVAVCGGLAFVVWVLGLLVLRNLIRRLRELIGEASLVEEVKRANAELESFSYSVAHDLRGPLRAIDGFSKALLDHYSDKVDERGRMYLDRTRENSRIMGQLINDLLGLSRVTRSEMRRERVDLTRLAREIAARLRRSAPSRDAEFVIADGLWVDADPGLMRVVLDNLLGNAWKYTARNPRSRIEFGSAPARGRRSFYVRDDGAGFDMTFADKLFKPFSRLHPAGEFEGTGIGLATVHRIIDRHGGRIWGEGRPGRGAQFTFTLWERQ